MSEDYMTDVMNNVEDVYSQMKKDWPPEEHFDRFLELFVESIRALDKNREAYDLMFAYIYSVFMSIAYGPELVHINLHSMLDNLTEYFDEPELDEGDLNMFDETTGKRLNIKDLEA